MSKKLMKSILMIFYFSDIPQY